MARSQQPIAGQELFEGMPEAPASRFDPEQLRAFGSIPGLLGRDLDIPLISRLDALALQRIQPGAIRSGLYGRDGTNTVNNLVISAEEYGAIVRNPKSFQNAVQAKTTAANRLTGDVRSREKELRSVPGAFQSKLDKYEKVFAGLASERGTLNKLAEWQHTPGYRRTSEADIRSLAGSAWNGSFRHILEVLRDKYGLSAEEHVNNVNAMAYKLFRGPQRERIAYWGGMLDLALSYNRNRTILFRLSSQKIVQANERLGVRLEEFYDQSGISPK